MDSRGILRTIVNVPRRRAFMSMAKLRTMRPTRTSVRAGKLLAAATYLLFLCAVSWHLYKNPLYRMDALQYAANALLIQKSDIVQIHRQIYDDVNKSIPQPSRDYLQGRQPGAPADQNRSREMRSKHPHLLGEFLPLFAIRPLYIQVIYLMHAAGVGLIRSTILISAISYFLLGALLYFWIQPYCGPLFAIVVSSLLMLSSPMTTLGSENISDCLATLVAFTAIYLILEKKLLTPGLTVLLASIYFRTDFVMLAAPVLVLCWRKRWLAAWQTAVLAGVALGSVLLINYFAGDYGMGMLYFRNFHGVPVAPGEMSVPFSLREYGSAFRHRVTLVLGSFFIPFLLAGLVCVFRAPRSRALFAVALPYSALHFLALPNWEERWFCVFYLSMGVAAGMALERQHWVVRLNSADGDSDYRHPEEMTLGATASASIAV